MSNVDDKKGSERDTVIAIPVTINVDNNTKENIKKPSVQFPAKLEQHFYPLKEETTQELESNLKSILDFIHTNFPSRVVRRVLKCTIAYFLSALFSLIQPLSQALAPAPFLTTTGMLVSHPGRSMGAQVDTSITGVLGICAAILYAFAGMAASVAYNNSHPDTYISEPLGRIINGLFLFVGICLAQSLRAAYPKFHFFSQQFMTIQIFSMSRAIDYTTVPFDLPWNYGYPLIIGHGISLVVNLVVWPETAIDGLGRALKETITSSRDILGIMTDQFFLNPQSELVPDSKVQEISEKMRKGMTKVKNAYREAKYEMSYAYIRPQQLGQIRKSMGRLTKHLGILGGCLKSERELFQSAIIALQKETRESDSDDEDTAVDQDPRPSYSEEDLNLLRTALRATNEFNHHPSSSPFSSRPGSKSGSRANSRAGSAYNSDDEDYVEHNQRSVNSLKSFLSIPKKLTTPTPKPPQKGKKRTEYNNRHLLLTYLESLRDPLMTLSLECANALECVGDSIVVELDIDRDDVSLRENYKSYIRHLLKIGTPAPAAENKERHKGSPTCNCSQTMRLAIEKFDKAERDRMHQLYQLNKTRGELDLGMRQELFLVFFFIFTMREVADEMKAMTVRMDEIRLSSRKSSFNGKRKRHFYFPLMHLNLKKWGKWARGNNHASIRDKGGLTFAALTTYMPKEEPESSETTEKDDEIQLTKIKTNGSIKRTQSRRESSVGIRDSNDTISPDMIRQRKRYGNFATHPTKLQQQRQQQQEENDEKKEKMPILQRFRSWAWEKYEYINKYDFKFTLKLATAVLVLCIPALVPASSGWYTTVRGQWAPLTVIAIMNPTSGGTLQASLWRIAGTLAGAFTGWAALAAGDGSPYLLGVFTVLLALPFFYIHLASSYNKVGMVTLTTYMVVALSRYASPPADETIEATVWKRTITLIVGICVALLLNSLVWPFVARHRVREQIAGCIAQLEEYYTFIMGTYLYHDPHVLPSEEDKAKGEKIESKIQSAIDVCDTLLELTDHEPRFRGPFAKLFYKEMIICLRNILDRMLSTRIALLKMPEAVKHDICAEAYHVYRRDMIASMLLCFHTLSSSLRSKTHLPVYMPSARAARIKLISQRRSDAQKTNWVRFRNLTWFAMACSSEEIIGELEYLSELVRYIVKESQHVQLAKKIDQFVAHYDANRYIYEVQVDKSKVTSLFTNS